jgi:hypothetical protein
VLIARPHDVRRATISHRDVTRFRNDAARSNDDDRRRKTTTTSLAELPVELTGQKTDTLTARSLRDGVKVALRSLLHDALKTLQRLPTGGPSPSRQARRVAHGAEAQQQLRQQQQQQAASIRGAAATVSLRRTAIRYASLRCSAAVRWQPIT